MDFTGKVALITGGANGIGRAAALGFARRGAKIVVVDRDAQGGAQTVDLVRQAGGDAIFVAADVSKSADVRNYVQATLDKYGRIDCFFNNAGIEGRIAPVYEYDEDVFDAIMAVNVRGVFLGLRHVLPVMIRQGKGAVVNTSSGAGINATPGMTPYVGSKHAVIGLTKGASGEVARLGIRVNAVCPGPIDTKMIHRLFADANPANPEAVGEAFKAATPLGRYGQPEDIANTVIFLCSDLASNMTGGVYTVDGGRTAVSGMAAATGTAVPSRK